MLRRFALVLLVAGLLAADAAAEPPEVVRHGPACTPAGCSGRSGSPLGLLAGFGLATLAIAAQSRRRETPPPA